MLLESWPLYCLQLIGQVAIEETLFRLWLIPNPVMLISGSLLTPLAVVGVVKDSPMLFWLCWTGVALAAVVVRLRGRSLYLVSPPARVRRWMVVPVVWSALWFGLAHITAYEGSSGKKFLVIFVLFIGALMFEGTIRIALGLMQCIAIHSALNALVDHGKHFLFLWHKGAFVAFVPALLMIVCCVLAGLVCESRVVRPAVRR